jgi:hypothetical protein
MRAARRSAIASSSMASASGGTITARSEVRRALVGLTSRRRHSAVRAVRQTEPVPRQPRTRRHRAPAGRRRDAGSLPLARACARRCPVAVPARSVRQAWAVPPPMRPKLAG